MAAQSFIAHGDRSSHPAPVRRNGLVQLGWPHFWLMAAILGGILSLVVFIFVLAYLVSA